MGGSGGGGYSGGGYSGGSGGGGTKSGGGGGGPDSPNPCAFQTNTALASPNPSVIPTLSVGNILQVVLNASGLAPIVEARTAAGATAGTFAGLPRLRDLIDCLQNGVAYEFQITAISGGRVEGALRNA